MIYKKPYITVKTKKGYLRQEKEDENSPTLKITSIHRYDDSKTT